MVIGLNGVKFTMVIRLSEVQFIIMVIGSNGVQFIMVIKTE